MTTKATIFLLLLTISVFSLSCMKTAIKKYKLNRHYTYIKQDKYLDQITKENGFNASELIYLDSASYSDFVSKYSSLFSLSPYLGSYFNDSVSVKKTDFLLNNEACMGRIEHELEKVLVSNRTDTFLRDTSVSLARLNFLRVADNQSVTLINKDKKLTIVMIYGYAFGSYYKNLFKQMETLRLNYTNDVELYILTMDPIYEQHLK